MWSRLLISLLLTLGYRQVCLGESDRENQAEITIDVTRVDPYVFPAPSEFSAYVVSGFVRSSETSSGVNGLQSVCVLVSAGHSTPVPGIEISVTTFEPGVAELERLRTEYNQFSKKLVNIYLDMPELSFFRLLDELPIEEQARIFSMMGAEDLARYLGMIGPQKARTITSLLARQRTVSAVYKSSESKGLAALNL